MTLLYSLLLLLGLIILMVLLFYKYIYHSVEKFDVTHYTFPLIDKLFISKDIKFLSNYFNFLATYSGINPEKNRYNILLDGEPDNISNIKDIDLLLTTKKDFSLLPKNVNIIYIPYCAYSFLENNIEPEQLLKTFPYISPYKKTKFCAFMYSNCNDNLKGISDRKKFYELLNNKLSVDNLGSCYNKEKPSSTISGHKNAKIMYEPYKFVIAFESMQIDGYITEKLTNPMLAGAIPIYLGAPDIKKYCFSGYIDVNDFKSFEECIDFIFKLNNDDILYTNFLQQPWLKNNIVDKEFFSIYYGGTIYKDIYNIFPKKLQKFLKRN